MRGRPYFGRTFLFRQFPHQDVTRATAVGIVDPDFDDLELARLEAVGAAQRKNERTVDLS